MMARFLAAFALALLLAPPAQAAKVCAWIVESNDADGRKLDLWLQSDQDIEGFNLDVGGDGVVTPSGANNSPSSATYALDAGKADKAWGMGATIDGPGRIDVVVELRKTPPDDTPDSKMPLLARYVFHRPIPPGETKPPGTLAKKQCSTVKP